MTLSLVPRATGDSRAPDVLRVRLTYILAITKREKRSITS